MNLKKVNKRSIRFVDIQVAHTLYNIERYETFSILLLPSRNPEYTLSLLKFIGPKEFSNMTSSANTD